MRTKDDNLALSGWMRLMNVAMQLATPTKSKSQPYCSPIAASERTIVAGNRFLTFALESLPS